MTTVHLFWFKVERTLEVVAASRLLIANPVLHDHGKEDASAIMQQYEGDESDEGKGKGNEGKGNEGKGNEGKGDEGKGNEEGESYESLESLESAGNNR